MAINVSKAVVFVYHMSRMQRIYSYIAATKPKERMDYVLEPMQALIQLACLSSCPTGTKVAINGNLLSIQHPSWTQGLLRTYNHDNKDDLFHLFNVIGRFKLFYAYLRRGEKGERGKMLYSTLVTMAAEGLERLLETYRETEKAALLQMLNMYKVMLAELIREPSARLVTEIEEDLAPTIDLSELAGQQRTSRANSLDSLSQTSESVPDLESDSDKKDIDNIFARIVSVYNDNELEIIYNTLILMNNDKTSSELYIKGLDFILEPVNKRIKKWISDNIVL